MERYKMFFYWKNQYCQKNYTTQGNLQIQCNPHKISMTFFTDLEQRNLHLNGKAKDSEQPKQS